MSESKGYDRQEVCRIIGQLRQEGLTFKAIAAWLNEHGYRRHDGDRFNCYDTRSLVIARLPPASPEARAEEQSRRKKVRENIARLRKVGLTPTRIAHWLNDRGYRTRTGRLFAAGNVNAQCRIADSRRHSKGNGDRRVLAIVGELRRFGWPFQRIALALNQQGYRTPQGKLLTAEALRKRMAYAHGDDLRECTPAEIKLVQQMGQWWQKRQKRRRTKPVAGVWPELEVE